MTQPESVAEFVARGVADQFWHERTSGHTSGAVGIAQHYPDGNGGGMPVGVRVIGFSVAEQTGVGISPEPGNARAGTGGRGGRDRGGAGMRILARSDDAAHPTAHGGLVILTANGGDVDVEGRIVLRHHPPGFFDLGIRHAGRRAGKTHAAGVVARPFGIKRRRLSVKVQIEHRRGAVPAVERRRRGRAARRATGGRRRLAWFRVRIRRRSTKHLIVAALREPIFTAGVSAHGPRHRLLQAPQLALHGMALLLVERQAAGIIAETRRYDPEGRCLCIRLAEIDVRLESPPVG